MISGLFSHLAIGLAVSFVGSVPPGAINLTAVKISLEKGYRAVLNFALAAALVEFFYGLLAVYGARFLAAHEYLTRGLDYITAVVFLGLGLYYTFGKSQAPEVAGEEAQTKALSSATPFVKGLTLGIFNPLCVPFWLAYTSFLQTRQWIHLQPATTLCYVTGIAAGAFVALSLFGLLSRWINDNLQLSTHVINRTIGIILIGLSLFKWVGMWW